MADVEFLKVPHLHEWALPAHGLKVETVDAHAGGHPLRLIIGGLPAPPGRTMRERQNFAREHYDHLRKALLFEPRGHPEMYGCLLTPPEKSGSHFGVLFMHRGGFGPLCGHGIIAMTTILLECGLVEMKAPETRLRIDTAAGMIRAYGQVVDNQVERVFYENLPSYAVASGRRLVVPDMGKVEYDLGYGGALFAFVKAASVGLKLSPGNSENILAAGRRIAQAIQAERVRQGPNSDDAGPADPGRLFGVVFEEAPAPQRAENVDARLVGVFAEECIDRSPGGMAMCAKMALLSADGKLDEADAWVAEGITGSTFRGHVVERQTVSQGCGVICEIEGQAWITGRHTFFIAADDPFRSGFLI